MSLYIFLYISVACALFYSGYIYYKVYKNVSAYFLFLSLSTFSIWLTLYLLGFTTTYDPEILVYLSRGMFISSILGMYFFLGFLYFLGKNVGLVKKKKILWNLFIFVSSFLIVGLLSPLVISDMTYIQDKGIYYESYGALYSVFVLLYLVFFPLFLFLSYYKISKIRKIEKLRIKYINIGFAIFVFLGVLLQVVFPLLGIFIFEKEIVLLLIPFLFSFWYIHNRYYFSDISLSVGKVAIFLFSLLFSFFIIFFINIYIQKLPSIYHDFWNISGNVYILEFCIGVVIHTFMYKILLRYLLPHSKSGLIVEGLSKLKEKMPRITTIQKLDLFLSDYFRNNFHIYHIYVETNPHEFHSDVAKYFDSGITRDIFINDLFFIENNKNKFSNYQELSKLSDDIYLILPGYSQDGKLSILLEVGRKKLGNTYGKEEILALKSFVKFLQGHIQYISIYKEIQDISINLDRKVDEKTIEFNNLLNKQKEFIAYVGHEIKNPITNTLFLSDSIKQDTEGKVDPDVSEDIGILYDELVKVSKLVKYIFSAEKFDLGKVKLYKEEKSIGNFIEDELHHFRHNYPYVKFSGKIQQNVMYSFDETQFRQVIQNLVNNSVKFINQKDPKIEISLTVEDGVIYIQIEDNGNGFETEEAENIFSKYVTGSGNATGLGMGLYLCKKIVELHGGVISAGKSRILGGASFQIEL